MSLVNTETGELVDLDRAAAERRAERIRLRLDAIADNYAAVMPMIREAIEKRDDLALGYRSPGEYVQDRFGGALTRLGVEVRREVVRELTAAGMSTRAIAPVVGTSHMQVARDVRAAVTHVTPQTPGAAASGAAPVRPEHTSQVAPVEEDTTAAAVEVSTNDATAATPEPEMPAPTRAPVVGIDGKTYARPEPKTPRRPPLPDAFFRAVHDARRKVESVHRLTQDDRWTQNAEKVAAIHRNDLLRINDLLQQVIASLPEQESTR